MSGCVWTVHPARARPGAAIGGAAVIIAAAVAVGLAAGHWAAGVAGAALLLFSSRHFFFPSHYTIDGGGVSVRCVGMVAYKPWSRLRRFRYDDFGAFLSTRSRRSLIDPLTGLHLTWAGNKDEVVPVIEGYMAGGETTEGRAGRTREPLTPGPSPQGDADRNRVREGADG